MQCDWFNKETDRPIAGQDRVRWENQTRDTGKKSRVRGVTRETQKKQEVQDEREITPRGRKQINRNGLI